MHIYSRGIGLADLQRNQHACVRDTNIKDRERVEMKRLQLKMLSICDSAIKFLYCSSPSCCSILSVDAAGA